MDNTTTNPQLEPSNGADKVAEVHMGTTQAGTTENVIAQFSGVFGFVGTLPATPGRSLAIDALNVARTATVQAITHA